MLTCRTCGYSEDLDSRLICCHHDWGKTNHEYPVACEQAAACIDWCFPYRFLPETIIGMCPAHSVTIEDDKYRRELTTEEMVAVEAGRRGLFNLSYDRAKLLKLNAWRSGI